MTVLLQKQKLYKSKNGMICEGDYKQITRPCDSLEEASKMIREFIEKADIGSSVFTGGDVYDDGQKVARISYNGKIWLPGSKYFE